MASLVGHGLIAAQPATRMDQSCEQGERWLAWNKVQFLSTGLALPPAPHAGQRNVTFCIDGVLVEANGVTLRARGDARIFVLEGDVTLTMPAR
jgi:hypothetical protein